MPSDPDSRDERVPIVIPKAYRDALEAGAVEQLQKLLQQQQEDANDDDGVWTEWRTADDRQETVLHGILRHCPLIKATVELLSSLLENDEEEDAVIAMIDVADRVDGNTALHLAAARTNNSDDPQQDWLLEIVELLLLAGVDVSLQNAQGQRAVDLATLSSPIRTLLEEHMEADETLWQTQQTQQVESHRVSELLDAMTRHQQQEVESETLAEPPQPLEAMDNAEEYVIAQPPPPAPEPSRGSSTSLPPVSLDALDSAIAAGDWAAVGAAAALLAGTPSDSQSASSTASSNRHGRSHRSDFDAARAAELDRLVDAGDWEGLALAAAAEMTVSSSQGTPAAPPQPVVPAAPPQPVVPAAPPQPLVPAAPPQPVVPSSVVVAEPVVPPPQPPPQVVMGGEAPAQPVAETRPYHENWNTEMSAAGSSSDGGKRLFKFWRPSGGHAAAAADDDASKPAAKHKNKSISIKIKWPSSSVSEKKSSPSSTKTVKIILGGDALTDVHKKVRLAFAPSALDTQSFHLTRGKHQQQQRLTSQDISSLKRGDTLVVVLDAATAAETATAAAAAANDNRHSENLILTRINVQLINGTALVPLLQMPARTTVSEVISKIQSLQPDDHEVNAPEVQMKLILNGRVISYELDKRLADYDIQDFATVYVALSRLPPTKPLDLVFAVTRQEASASSSQILVLGGLQETERINSLKERLFQVLQPRPQSVNHIRLSFNDAELQDDQTIGKCGLSDQSKVHLTILSSATGRLSSLKIKTLAGKEVNLENVLVTTLVVQLREQLEPLLAMPASRMRLILNGRELSVDDNLADAKVLDGSTIMVVLRSFPLKLSVAVFYSESMPADSVSVALQDIARVEDLRKAVAMHRPHLQIDRRPLKRNGTVLLDHEYLFACGISDGDTLLLDMGAASEEANHKGVATKEEHIQNPPQTKQPSDSAAQQDDRRILELLKQLNLDHGVLQAIVQERSASDQEEAEKDYLLRVPAHRDFYLFLVRKTHDMVMVCQNLSTGMVKDTRTTPSDFFAAVSEGGWEAVLDRIRVGRMVSTAIKWAKKQASVVPGSDAIGSFFQLIVDFKDKRDRQIAVANVAMFATLARISEGGLHQSVDKFARYLTRARAVDLQTKEPEPESFARPKSAILFLLGNVADTPAKEQGHLMADKALDCLMKTPKDSKLGQIISGNELQESLAGALASRLLEVPIAGLCQFPPLGVLTPQNATSKQRALNFDSSFVAATASFDEETDARKELEQRLCRIEKQRLEDNARFEAQIQQWKDRVATLEMNLLSLQQERKEERQTFDNILSRLDQLENGH